MTATRDRGRLVRDRVVAAAEGETDCASSRLESVTCRLDCLELSQLAGKVAFAGSGAVVLRRGSGSAVFGYTAEQIRDSYGYHPEAVDAADLAAVVPGVDALFVGPPRLDQRDLFG